VQQRYSGLLLDAIADAFRVKPILDLGSEGRQLREWCAGRAKERETRRAIIGAITTAALVEDESPRALRGPMPDADVAEVATRVLDRWSRWCDSTLAADAPAGDPMLGASWLIEHTLNLWASVVAITRYAWGIPCPTEARIADWLPSGFDQPDRSLSGELIDDTFARAQATATMTSILQKLEVLGASAGKAVKPDTVKRWRQGATVPKGTRVSHIAKVAEDPWLRIKLGARGIVERLATFRGDPTQNRNATLFWLVTAEHRAVHVQRELERLALARDRTLHGLGLDDVLSVYLPALTPDRTANDLPFQLLGKHAVLLEVKQDNERAGFAFIPIPPDGQPTRVIFTLSPDVSVQLSASPNPRPPNRSS
jgi:hypothetical protein